MVVTIFVFFETVSGNRKMHVFNCSFVNFATHSQIMMIHCYSESLE